MKNFRKSIESLKEILIRYGYLDENGQFTEKAFKLYAGKIIGNIEREISGVFEYGKYKSNRIGNEELLFKKKFGIGDRYNEIDIKESIRKTLKYNLINFVAEKRMEYKGGRYIILFDVSGSMINKIYEAKRALITLLEKIIEDNNKVYIILYNDKILYSDEIKNLKDFIGFIIKINPNGSTDISLALKESYKYAEGKFHVIIITDALPTYGKNPVEETYNAAKKIRDLGGYISLIGIKLDEEGEKIGKKICEIGNGKLFIVKDLNELEKIFLISYYETKSI